MNKDKISQRVITTFMVFLWVISGFGCGNDTEKQAGSKKIITVATDVTLIPMSYLNDEHQIVGFEPDLIRAIADKSGFDVQMINVEWPGLFGGLITRKFDMVISSVTILEERKQRMAFSIPYLKSGLALVVRRGNENVNRFEDVEKQDLMVGAQMGTTAYFYLEKRPKIRKKGYQVYGHAVADLIKGEVDAVLGESTGTLYYKNQNKDYFQKIKMVGEILTDEYYGIVLHKENTDLLNQVNAALTDLLKDGTVSKLHQKWELGRAAEVPKFTDS